MNTTPDHLLDTKQAAQLLGLCPATLKKLRSCPEGSPLPPIPFRKYSPRCVRYSHAELQAWMTEAGKSGGAA